MWRFTDPSCQLWRPLNRCSEAWPLCEQKRNLIYMGRRVVRALEAIRVLPPWVEESLDLLQTGGQAWTDAEKAKIADLNWRIVAEKQ
jgi:sterol 24-C-methyltransferase